MVRSASKRNVMPLEHKLFRTYLVFLLVMLGSLTVWWAYATLRRPFVGQTDPDTGDRFTFTVASEYPLSSDARSEWSEKRDSLAFSPPPPVPFLVWLEKLAPHKTSAFLQFPYLKNEICVCSGSQIRSRERSPFRNFQIHDGYPMPRHPDFADRPGSVVIEEKFLLVSGQPAIWRVTRVDLLPATTGNSVPGKGADKFYDYMLVVKVTGKDLWFAVTGAADEDHQRQIQKEVRAVGDSLRIEHVATK